MTASPIRSSCSTALLIAALLVSVCALSSDSATECSTTLQVVCQLSTRHPHAEHYCCIVCRHSDGAAMKCNVQC